MPITNVKERKWTQYIAVANTLIENDPAMAQHVATQVSLRTELKFASLYVGGYPVRIERIVLVDVTTMVRVVLKALKRALPAKIRSKFHEYTATKFKNIRELYAELDCDKDGQISIQDWRQGLRNCK